MTLALVLFLAASAPTHRYALVVGSNVGDGMQLAPLRYADDDAVAMHELLVEAGVDSVLLAAPDADTARLHPATHPAARPTLAALRAAFDAQRDALLRAQAAGEDVEWLFFFSGHGDVDRGEGFLGLEAGRLTRAVLHDELLAKLPQVRTHVVLDACRSGAIVGAKGPGGRRLPMPAAFVADASWPDTAGFVVSSSASRESHEWEQVQAGVFSYEVRSALRGAADADGDGRVTYGELGAFLEVANRGIDNPRFRPEFHTLPPRARVGLSTPLLAWKGPAIETDLAEHAYVERGNGERLLDVHLAQGQLASLHLPAERPLFFRSNDEQREVTLEADVPRVSALTTRATAVTRKGALERSFTQLFATPFEATVVKRYTDAWRPIDLSTLLVPAAPPAALTGHVAARWTAILGAVAGAAGFAVAWQQRPEDLSPFTQEQRVARNGLLTGLNALGVSGLSLSLVSAATWALLSWRFELPAWP